MVVPESLENSKLSEEVTSFRDVSDEEVDRADPYSGDLIEGVFWAFNVGRACAKIRAAAFF